MKKAILTMGLPAAGKTTVINNEYDITNYNLIDPDEIKQEKTDYDPKNPQKYHAWSKIEAEIRTLRAIQNGENIIIDGTGTSAEKMYGKIQRLQTEGYEVTLLYVKVTLKTALARNAARERNVDETIILKKAQIITTSFEILSTLADNVKIIKND